MPVIGAKAAAIVYPSPAIEKIKEHGPQGSEAEKARLRKATEAFESFFMFQLLKTMRRTIPETDLNEGGPFSGDMSKDIFTEMFDLQLADRMVNGDRGSISAILYQSLVKLIEAKYEDADEKPQIKSFERPESEPVKLDRSPFEPIPAPSRGVDVEPSVDQFLPVSARAAPIAKDRVLSEFGAYIDRAAQRTGLDPALIISVIKVESNGDPNAVSSAGAKGLMQLIDSTAADYGVSEVFDPEANIEAGSHFLKDLLDRFGSLRLALAAYNAGPENVRRYGEIPPFPETRRYVEKVIDTLNTISGATPGASAKERR